MCNNCQVQYNCNNSNISDVRESVNCAIQDCCEIEGFCEDILFETSHLRRNDSCEAIRIISRDIEEIEELTDCISEDIKDINHNKNRQQLNTINKSICNIHKGLDEIEKGLSDVCHNNLCEGVQEIREGDRFVKDNAEIIKRALRNIVFEDSNNNCDKLLDINIRINKCCY